MILLVMSEKRIIEVKCKCGQALARYEKDHRGKLIKMYLERIIDDHAGVFLNKDYVVNDLIYCPKCNQRVAAIVFIHGMKSAKLNQGQILPIRT
jgi:hypothetical protein